MDEINKDLVLLFTVALVGCAAALPVCVWLFFRQSGMSIGRGVGWLAFGNACGLAGTTVFAVVEYCRGFDVIGWKLSTALRLTVGSVVIITSCMFARALFHVLSDYKPPK